MKCFCVPGLNWARTPLAELTAERLVLSSLPLPSWHGSRGRREEEEGRGKCLQLMIGIKSNQDRGRVRLRLLLVARRDRSWICNAALHGVGHQAARVHVVLSLMGWKSYYKRGIFVMLEHSFLLTWLLKSGTVITI